MNNVLTVKQVRDAEAAVYSRGISGTFLSFNAALAVADGIYERASASGSKSAVFCGGGGNGRDGMIAAARLFSKGCDIVAYVVGDFSAVCDRLGEELNYAKNAGVPVLPAAEYCGKENILIDCIFGIGLDREVTGDIAELIDKLNAADGVFRLAVDIPSGLNADTGEVMGTAFNAHITMTFSCYKRGMITGEGRNVCGKIIVEDVGIPTKSNIRVIDDADFKPVKRKNTAHKGNFGKIYIIGGSGGMIGAPIMSAAAAHAAYMSGAGTVTVCVPEIHRVALSARSTMSMMKYMPDTDDGFIRFDKQALDEIICSATAIAIGMGMGACPDLKKILEYLCENFSGSLIIDADGLNAMQGGYGFLGKAKPGIVITPHAGEFKRLTGKDATIENAVALAREVNAVVVMKSATTVITDGNDVRVNISGTPAMAKGGTGDVLSGCIAGLSATYSLMDAASVACYRNGLGAERAVSSFAEFMLTPRDILKMANYPELPKD